MLAFKKRLSGRPLDGDQRCRAMQAQRDPDQMLMWIHEAAAYRTLLASGAERSGSCNVPHWLYWITAAWPQYKGWLQTLTQLRLPT